MSALEDEIEHEEIHVVETQQDLLEHYNDMRLRKLHHYVMYEVTEDDDLRECQIKDSAPTETTSRNIFESFVKSLPETDCRYIAFDYRYKSQNDALLNKLVFIIWCPDSVEDDVKTRYHNAKRVLRKNMTGIEYEVFATRYEDFVYEEFKELIGVT